MLVACVLTLTLDLGVIKSDFAQRYLAGSAAKTCQTALACVALVMLVRACAALNDSRRLSASALLPEVPQGGQLIESIPQLQAMLRNKISDENTDLYPARLREGLDAVRRRESGESLAEDLKSLAERDAARLAAERSTTRLLICAIPIVGLIGAVVGLGDAAQTLIPKQWDATWPLAAAKSAAVFEAFAAALGLSVPLLILSSWIAKTETALLDAVDSQAREELSARFPSQLAIDDPLHAVVERLLHALLPQQDKLLHKQVELWQATVDEAHDHWTQLSTATGQQVTGALTEALTQSLAGFADTLVAKHAAQADGAATHWDQIRQALDRATDVLVKQQNDMARQGVILLKVADASKHIAQTEATLNENLRTLNATQQFQETMVALSATLQLLSARIHALPSEHETIELPRVKKTRGRAA
ncbi:MAG: MotA/TolQ/ExbB proton channel family protein [Pirellulales bacterium]